MGGSEPTGAEEHRGTVPAPPHFLPLAFGVLMKINVSADVLTFRIGADVVTHG